MPCCNCCCPDGESCCKAQGANGICCPPSQCCGTNESPVCCPEGECCVDDECGACPCEGACEGDGDCDEGCYCCDGVCQEEPCDPPPEPCESDEDCRACEEGVLVSGAGFGDTIVYACCPEGSTGVFPFGDARAGRCCVDCSEESEEEGTSGNVPTSGICCNGECVFDCGEGEACCLNQNGISGCWPFTSQCGDNWCTVCLFFEGETAEETRIGPYPTFFEASTAGEAVCDECPGFCNVSGAFQCDDGAYVIICCYPDVP